MIKASELRIGNWIYETRICDPLPEDLCPIQVAVVNAIDNIVRDVDDAIYTFDDLHPIPISPEILEKAGFARTPYKDVPPVYRASKLHDYPMMTHTYYRYEFNGFKVSEDLMCKGVKLKYLHQLQNLYFALTGTELHIEL